MKVIRTKNKVTVTCSTESEAKKVERQFKSALGYLDKKAMKQKPHQFTSAYKHGFCEECGEPRGALVHSRG